MPAVGTMPKAKCSHPVQTRSGSNGTIDMISCQTCKKVLLKHFAKETDPQLLMQCGLVRTTAEAPPATPSATPEASSSVPSRASGCHVQ